MVWFHGGAFIFGSGSSYEPQYFLDEDVILITVNYRLGALGRVHSYQLNTLTKLSDVFL